MSSKRCSLWRPRKRGNTGTFSSGYCTVVVPAKICPKVVFSPRAVSRNVRQVPRVAPGLGERTTSITSSAGRHSPSRSGTGGRGSGVAPRARGAARAGVLVGHQSVATTTIAVTSALSVASGSSTFQPKLISWS